MGNVIKSTFVMVATAILAALFSGVAVDAKSTVAVVPVTQAERDEHEVTQLTDSEHKRILASTLQIAMFEHAAEAGSSEAGSQGLGTLVAFGDEMLILTHDHWGHLTPNLNEVIIRDAQGVLLLALDSQAFMSLIAYRDGGAMVLRAPVVVEGLVAAMPAINAVEGDVVWLARRDAARNRDTVEVVPAMVTAVRKAGSGSNMRLRSLDGSVVSPGDSGGGVWANGRLVGNLWAITMESAPSSWRQWFGGVRDWQPTGEIVVGMHPLHPSSVLSDNDLLPIWPSASTTNAARRARS